MSWQYRIMKRKVDDNYTDYGIYEFYNMENGDKLWDSEPQVYAESVEDLRWMLEHMLKALGKTILDHKTGETIDAQTEKDSDKLELGNG